jgi:hypothetical protein
MIAPSEASGQGGAMTPEERAVRAEVAAFRFTIADLRAWYAAQTALARYWGQRPDQAPEDEDYETLSRYQQHLDGIPAAKNIVESNGLTTRKFVLLTGAWGLASLAHSRVQRGADPAAAAREAGAPPENVAVFREHSAEIAKLQETLDAASADPR